MPRLGQGTRHKFVGPSGRLPHATARSLPRCCRPFNESAHDSTGISCSQFVPRLDPSRSVSHREERRNLRVFAGFRVKNPGFGIKAPA